MEQQSELPEKLEKEEEQRWGAREPPATPAHRAVWALCRDPADFSPDAQEGSAGRAVSLSGGGLRPGGSSVERRDIPRRPQWPRPKAAGEAAGEARGIEERRGCQRSQAGPLVKSPARLEAFQQFLMYCNRCSDTWQGWNQLLFSFGMLKQC